MLYTLVRIFYFVLLLQEVDSLFRSPHTCVVAFWRHISGCAERLPFATDADTLARTEVTDSYERKLVGRHRLLVLRIRDECALLQEHVARFQITRGNICVIVEKIHADGHFIGESNSARGRDVQVFIVVFLKNGIFPFRVSVFPSNGICFSLNAA